MVPDQPRRPTIPELQTVTTPVTRPADRYGDRPRRRFMIPGIVAVLALIAGVVFWMAQVADAPVRSSLLSWQNPVDGTMVATLEVVRSPGTAVTCDVVAVDLRQIVVGQTQVDLPAGPQRRLEVSVEIPLQGDGVAPEIRSCRPAGQEP